MRTFEFSERRCERVGKGRERRYNTGSFGNLDGFQEEISLVIARC